MQGQVRRRMHGQIRPKPGRCLSKSGPGGGLEAHSPNHFQHLLALSRGEARGSTVDEDGFSDKSQSEEPYSGVGHGSVPSELILCTPIRGSNDSDALFLSGDASIRGETDAIKRTTVNGIAVRHACEALARPGLRLIVGCQQE